MRYSCGSVEEDASGRSIMQAYDDFLDRVRDIHRIGALQGHLGWDQDVLMPPKGGAARSEMMAWLAGQRHQRLTDPAMGTLLDELEHTSLEVDAQANVREIRRAYTKACCLPSALSLIHI